MGLTYRKLLEILSKVPDWKLDDNMSVFTPEGEFMPIFHVAQSVDNGILDDGHIYLSADEILYAGDKAVNEN